MYERCCCCKSQLTFRHTRLHLTAGEDQYIDGMTFTHSLNLASGCGLPPYTNYTEGFHGTLDYVFYDTGSLEVAQVGTIPSLVRHEPIFKQTILKAPRTQFRHKNGEKTL